MAISKDEGRVGGKFFKRPLRRLCSTPYDRPPSAVRGISQPQPANEAGRSKWFSKLVYSASQIIVKGVSRLFSPVFGKGVTSTPGVEEKHLVKLDTSIVILAEQKLADSGISDIEQFISQRWFTRAEAEHFMTSLKSRSSELLKSESENNKQVKVLKRDISCLDDENILLGPLCKIPKKSIIDEDKVVVNVPFTMVMSGDQITNTIVDSHMTFPSKRKSCFHISAPEDVDLDEDVVGNAPCTTNGMNETSASSTSSMTIIRSSNTTISCHNILPSQKKSYFHMSAPEDIDDSDEEYDATEEYDQPLFNLGVAMNDGSTETCGSSNEGDFTFPILIDLNNHFSPPSPTMGSPSPVKLPFQKD